MSKHAICLICFVVIFSTISNGMNNTLVSEAPHTTSTGTPSYSVLKTAQENHRTNIYGQNKRPSSLCKIGLRCFENTKLPPCLQQIVLDYLESFENSPCGVEALSAHNNNRDDQTSFALQKGNDLFFAKKDVLYYGSLINQTSIQLIQRIETESLITCPFITSDDGKYIFSGHLDGIIRRWEKKNNGSIIKIEAIKTDTPWITQLALLNNYTLYAHHGKNSKTGLLWITQKQALIDYDTKQQAEHIYVQEHSRVASIYPLIGIIQKIIAQCCQLYKH